MINAPIGKCFWVGLGELAEVSPGHCCSEFQSGSHDQLALLQTPAILPDETFELRQLFFLMKELSCFAGIWKK